MFLAPSCGKITVSAALQQFCRYIFSVRILIMYYFQVNIFSKKPSPVQTFQTNVCYRCGLQKTKSVFWIEQHRVLILIPVKYVCREESCVCATNLTLSISGGMGQNSSKLLRDNLKPFIWITKLISLQAYAKIILIKRFGDKKIKKTTAHEEGTILETNLTSLS